MEFITVASLIFALLVLLISLIMLLPHKLSKKSKDAISKVGLMHFTTEEAAEKIIGTSVIRVYKPWRCAYFFQNGIVSMDAISYNNLKNKTTCVEILNLTEYQLSHLRIRYYDMAVIHFGDFHISNQNQISVKTETDISKLHTNLHFNINIALILLSIATFALLFILFLTTLAK